LYNYYYKDKKDLFLKLLKEIDPKYNDGRGTLIKDDMIREIISILEQFNDY
jgi:hypothetical protein